MTTTSVHEGYEDLQPSIGDRLRIARERRTDMDQAQFAEHIGVSRGTVSNYERDKLPGGPRQRLVLNAWAAATETTRDWLETGLTPSEPRPDGGLEDLRARRDSNSQPSDPKVLPFEVRRAA